MEAVKLRTTKLSSVGTAKRNDQVLNHDYFACRARYAMNRWKMTKGRLIPANRPTYILKFVLDQWSISLSTFVTEASVSSQLFLFLSSLEVETLSISEETVNPKDEKIGPNSFELLKVLGKGSFGKVSRFIVVLSMFSVELYSSLSWSESFITIIKFRFTLVWNAVGGGIKK